MNEIRVLEGILTILKKGEKVTHNSIADACSLSIATVRRSIVRLNTSRPDGLGMEIVFNDESGYRNGSFEILDWGALKGSVYFDEYKAAQG